MSTAPLVGAAVLVVILWIYSGQQSEVELVASGPQPGAPKFLVVERPDKVQAAAILGRVASGLRQVVTAMQQKHPDDPNVAQMAMRFREEAISEGTHESGYTSFSVNKGERIVLCIRNVDGTFVDHNVVMYVALHELAHIMTPQVGHTALFWKNFRSLLDCSMEIGLYRRVD
jgi:hypothetical protein